MIKFIWLFRQIASGLQCVQLRCLAAERLRGRSPTNRLRGGGARGNLVHQHERIWLTRQPNAQLVSQRKVNTSTHAAAMCYNNNNVGKERFPLEQENVRLCLWKMLTCLRGVELCLRRSCIRNAASLCNRIIISVDLHLRSLATESCTANVQLARKSDASHPRNRARVGRLSSNSPQASVLLSTLIPGLETDDHKVLSVFSNWKKTVNILHICCIVLFCFLHSNEPTFCGFPIQKQVFSVPVQEKKSNVEKSKIFFVIENRIFKRKEMKKKQFCSARYLHKWESTVNINVWQFDFSI